MTELWQFDCQYQIEFYFLVWQGHVKRTISIHVTVQNRHMHFDSSVHFDSCDSSELSHTHLAYTQHTGYCTGHWLLKFEIPNYPTWVGQEDSETVEIMNFGYV